MRGAAAVDVDISSGDGVLVGHFNFIQALRALVNLLENALEFSRGGPVELTARRTGDQLLFHVKNRGIGIDPTEAERIFEALLSRFRLLAWK